jgi:hypothetical protein
MDRYREMSLGRRRPAKLTTAALAICVFALVVVGADRNLDRFGSPAAFTGEIVAGQPVYRLPSIEVVADRQPELATTGRGEGQAHRAQSKAGRPGA